MHLPRSGRISRTAALLLAVGLGLWGGCEPPAVQRLVILREPVLVTAAAGGENGEEDVFQFEVEHAGQRLTVPTRLSRPPEARHESSEALAARLRDRTAWKPPWLFVREENGGGNGWRADVDHVFRVSPTNLIRVGTVSARLGPPGAQLVEGRFLDLYDRLEFTLLTAHANAPGFTLVMDERDGRFVADRAAIWARAEERFRAARDQLRQLGAPEQRPVTIPARREACAPALFCLALARYCDRADEFQSCLELARQALGDVDDLRAEVAPIVPGELAPSADRVLRSHPALVNLFRESTAAPDESAGVKVPPSVAAPIPAPSGE